MLNQRKYVSLKYSQAGAYVYCLCTHRIHITKGLLICTLYLCISKYSEKLKQVLVPTILGRNVYGYGLASKLLPTAIITYVLYYVPVPRYLLLM